MATIKHEYTKKELKKLTPEFEIQIGPDLHLLRAVDPKEVAKANARIQKGIDSSYSKSAEILKKAKASRRLGTIILNC